MMSQGNVNVHVNSVEEPTSTSDGPPSINSGPMATQASHVFFPTEVDSDDDVVFSEPEEFPFSESWL